MLDPGSLEGVVEMGLEGGGGGGARVMGLTPSGKSAEMLVGLSQRKLI